MCDCRPATVSREKCNCCDEEYAISYQVPDSIWLAINGKMDGKLCLRCFSSKGDALGIEWCEWMYFYPISKAAIEI